jgi:ribulose kinase
MVIGAREREVGMSALANIAGARAIILDASHSCDLGQAAMGAHIAKVVRPDGGTVCQRRCGARRRGRPGIR